MKRGRKELDTDACAAAYPAIVLRVPVSLRVLEKIFMVETLQCYNWNVSVSAKMLGIDRRTLQRKMIKHNIKRFTGVAA